MARTPSVWRWQLIFACGLLSVTLMIAGLKPEIFGSGLFSVGLMSALIVTVVVMIVPWERLPRAAVAAVPFADIVAIGLLTSSPEIRLGYLWVFPITWIATYYGSVLIAAAIVLISCCLIAFGSSAGGPEDVTLRVLATVISLGFLGAIIHIGTRRSRASRRLLRRQSEQLNRAARRAATHERRVTQIIDALDIALVAVSDDGVLRKMNDAYRRLYGRDRFGAELPAPAVEYDDRRGEPLPPEQTTLARATRGEEMIGERVWLYDTDGQWRALQASTQPIAAMAGARRVTLLIIEDVTESLAAAEERRAMTAIVSHELRNPLTAILGHVDLLLERDDLPMRAQEQLAAIANAGERMERLVCAGLEDSRPDSEVLSEPVDLRQLAEASVALFQPTAAAKDMDLRIDGVEALGVRGDAFRLRQALDNLLSNALKYTRAGGTVTVRLRRDGGVTELAVDDTGDGISDADLERLFQPYFRTEAAVRSGVPGTGLGLVIVQEVVAAHGARIEVSSELGVGTTVAIRFPGAADAVTRAPRAPGALAGTPGAPRTEQEHTGEVAAPSRTTEEIA